MRILNQKYTVRGFLFSGPMSFVYFFVCLFFAYKCLTLLPTWLTVKTKAEDTQADYDKKIFLVHQKELAEQNKETDLGKKRYQKEFFNKLDEGENMIVLYGHEEEKSPEELKRKMFWWEEWQQSFDVWWKNLEIMSYFKK